MNRSKAYYVTRDVVRVIFWLGVIYAGLWICDSIVPGIWR